MNTASFFSNTPGWWAALACGALGTAAYYALRNRHRVRTLRGVQAVLQELIDKAREKPDITALPGANTGKRADPTSAGPLGELARTVNQLAGVIEERRLAAAQDQENLHALLRHIVDAVLITDGRDRIILFNPAAEKLLDRPVPAVLGLTLSGLLNQRELLELHHQAAATRLPQTAQFRLTATRRSFPCEATATALYVGNDFRGTLLFIRDLTDITAAFQMKTEFVSNASHELRTPLATIRSAVETIQDSWPEVLDEPRGPSGDMTKRCIDIIGGHVLRLQMLVQDLLDLSRSEDSRALVRMDRVDLTHVSELVNSMYTGIAAEKKITLTVELAPEARSMRGDERLLILTLKNLVDNALKFTPTGGSVTIRSRVRPLENRPGQETLLEVSDTGCGIPPEDQQRVFERFYTVNRSRGGADRGTGLGLAIVKHAVAAMGGTVMLESELNQGTTIRCAFPIKGTDNPSVIG